MHQVLQQSSFYYKAPPLARIFHSFPHVNVSLHLVNSTFDPDSDVYTESIGILGSIPAAWLIMTLFLLLVYLLTRCCDRKPRPKHSIIVLKWTLALFAVLCCGAIGVSLYGNDDLHNGLVQFVAAATAIDESLTSIKNQTNLIETTIQDKILSKLVELQDVFEKPVQNQTARGQLLSAIHSLEGNASACLASCRDVSRPLKHISLALIIKYIALSETFRWPVTMAVLSVLLVFCIVLLFGVARHSRYALIMFSVVGLFAVIISWFLSSVYLALSVAIGDLCISPNSYIEKETPASLQADVLSYYLNCGNNSKNPLSVVIQKGTNSINTMIGQLRSVSEIADKIFTSGIHPQLELVQSGAAAVSQMLNELGGLIECRRIHFEYNKALYSLCNVGLFGLALMLVASITSGLFFTILVWLDSHAWIYIRKRSNYMHVADRDPFLPPTAASQAVAARTLRGQGRDVSSNGTTLRGGSGSASGSQSIGIISNQRLAIESSQYATLNRKFRTLEHPSRGRPVVSFDAAGTSHTLGHHKKQMRDREAAAATHYSTLSKKCKTLDSTDFY